MATHLSASITRRLVLCRYFLRLASDNAALHQEAASFASVTMLHDAIEIFLLAAAEQLNASISRRTEFEQYLDKINEKLAPDELPNRAALLRFNKLRVSTKHDAIRPDRDELGSFLVALKEFFETTSKKIFHVDFWTVSLIDLVNDGEAKTLLLEAEREFNEGNYAASLIEVRKAFFLSFEKAYDIKDFEEGGTDDPMFNALMSWGNKSPYWARNKKHIKEHVNDPLDYIQLDHARVDSDLVKDGIDPTTFWNVWRLTPAVYRHKNSDAWAIKYEPKKTDTDGARERAAYALESTIDILITLTLRQRSLKWIDSNTDWIINLKPGAKKLYKKADRTSEVSAAIPDNVNQLSVDYSTPGLQGDGNYWHVSHFQDPRTHLYGYLHEDDAES